MRAKLLGRVQNTAAIHRALHPLRRLDNITNLKYLAIDYLTLIAFIGSAIYFCESRARWGVSWLWDIPVIGVAVVLIGAVQHRLAGLGHEAAHYTLLKNKFWEEVVSDWFCMFPIFAVTHQYRIVHMAHHQYTNDWQHDPDLLVIGKSKMMDKFPMGRWEFIRSYYMRFLFPPVLLRYLWDVMYLSTFGKGQSIYQRSHSEGNGSVWTSLLGLAYVFSYGGTIAALNSRGQSMWVCLMPVIWLCGAIIVIAMLPAKAYVQSPLKAIYSAKVTSVLRLAWLTMLIGGLGIIRALTGRNFGFYLWTLWVLPLFTSFPYYMLLRDVYQHANADDGKLTNSRVFFTDRFTRWAVFVYGMDMHIPHHMYPAIPHYNLAKAHEALREGSPEYADHVVECHGTFHNSVGKPTILDVMLKPTSEQIPTDPGHRHTHAA